MQKVISINLNGNAYQLEESGYDVLRDYLARADQQLSANPDRAEIVRDLEQAIADRCQKFLGPHKTVVLAGEIARIVAEMGPVSEGAAEGGAPREEGHGTGNAGEPRGTGPKRLYRIPDGAMIAGVCSGLAAYAGIDVTIVRVLFVVAAFLTQGVGILAYVIMMFVVPQASTPEERAAAGPAPLNAKDVVDRAKKQFAEGRRQWRRQQRRMAMHRPWHPGVPYPAAPPPWTIGLLPVFAVVHVALFLIAAAAAISLVNTQGILSWPLPPDVPLWAALLILFVAYQVVVSPIRMLEQWTKYAGAGMEPATVAFWNAVAGLTALALAVWIASQHVPELREFVQKVPDVVHAFGKAVGAFFARTAS
jgi:phage shock protein PspC (stress-responsive transcriptional regulator)